jgi:hypothetical protein
VRLTSGSELMKLNKDRLETCSLSFSQRDNAVNGRTYLTLTGSP